MCPETTTEERETDGPETADDDSLPSKARRIVAHLEERLTENDELYVKSRFVADEIDLSAKEVGWYLTQLQETATSLTIEQWAYTNGTTWRVTRGEPESN